MTIKERLEEDIKQTMRDRNQPRLGALRFLKNAVLMLEKDKQIILDDTGVSEVIAKQVKDRRESIIMFEKGGRKDLVAKESVELAVLEEYLPPQMSVDELSNVIRDVIEELGALTLQDKGKVMGKLMPQVRGLADGAEVNDLVEKMLGSA
ncbi:MAG: GatB/YqeY domain-containing protein [Chloroflexota bacterium]|nr:GatB/YqeY domain-containing protein [Chloroflexota bacterium]